MNQTQTVNLTCVGGTAPYTYQVLSDAQTTIAATIAGSAMTVDATAVTPGVYSVHVRAIDANANVSMGVIPIYVADGTVFSILNDDVNLQPTTLPYAGTVALLVSGSTGSVTWSLLPNLTTLPAATLTGSTLSFNLTATGSWTVGLRATDQSGNTATKVLEVEIQTSPAFVIMDGQVEVIVAPTTAQEGTHSFTLTVRDSALTPTVLQQTFNYTVGETVSIVDTDDSFIDHNWTGTDSTPLVIPVVGDLSGFQLVSSDVLTSANGIVVSVDAASQSLIFTGPAAGAQNSEVTVPIALFRAGQQVATVSREFTLISFANASTAQCNTRPYVIGDTVGLNPRKPFFNSANLPKGDSIVVSLRSGQTLPKGLSLDSVTGQVYGTLLDSDVAQSILDYRDGTVVVASIAINWDIQPSKFQLTDVLGEAQTQATYSGTLTAPTGTTLTTVVIHRGRLPVGLQLSIDSAHNTVLINGTTSEAGMFDIWLTVTNSVGQSTCFYKRFISRYVPPLVILTDGIDSPVTNQAYTEVLQAFGGVAPYTWALATGTLPTGLSFSTATGAITGTTTVSTYSQSLTFRVTDSRAVSVTKTFTVTIDNTLRIVTAALPRVIPGQRYNYQLLGGGGVTPYTWSLNAGSPALPSGLTLASTGLISGATSLEDFDETITIKLLDHAGTVVTKNFDLSIGTTSGLLIDSSGVGPIPRGGPYHGTLIADGSGVLPYQWSIAPDSPNQLPAGLTISADAGNNGATASITGVTTAHISNLPIEIQVVDIQGNFAYAYVLVSTYSTLKITTTNLPDSEVGGTYSIQLNASGYNPPFTFALDGTSPPLPASLSLTSSGLLSGTTSATFSNTLVFDVTDALNDSASAALHFNVQYSTLAITTTSLPDSTAAVAYNANLAASGGVAPLTWSVSPSTANQLPSGLSLSSSGVISGTTLAAGFNAPITFRVTDNLGVYRELALNLLVKLPLTLKAGPDYANSSSGGRLGYNSGGDVTGINPRPNSSFYVIATGVLTQDPNALGLSVPGGFSAQVDSLSGGIAHIRLSGPFGSGPVGDNNFSITVTDSGLSITQNFIWTVAPPQTVRVAPTSGSLPVQYIN